MLDNQNAMLWWMIKQAAEVSGDRRLNQLRKSYVARYQEALKASPWHSLLTDLPSPGIESFDLTNAPDYNLLFFYAESCDEDFGSSSSVRAQLNTNFCFLEHPLGPACITHQMIGFRLMQKSLCGDQQFVADSLDTLANYVRWQLITDFRPVDVYFQRLLMLHETGHKEMVSDRWIERFFDAQLPDGGWASSWQVMPAGQGRYLSIDQSGLAIVTPKSNFHATAQGVLLTKYLIREYE